MITPQIFAVLFLVSSTLAVPRTQVHLERRSGFWDTAKKYTENTLLKSASRIANRLNGDYKKPLSLPAGIIAKIPKASGDEIATIEKFSKLAKAAYDVDDEAHGPGHIKMMKNWECELCKSSGLVPDKKPVSVLANHDSSTHTYITSFKSINAIVVAFKGTDDKTDIYDDIVAIPIDGPSEMGGHVHKGFSDSFEAGRSFVISEVDKLVSAHKDYDIVVTGHSLGGAIATIAAGVLSTKYPNRHVRLITYCQPRVGGTKFAKAMYNKKNLTGMRYVHYNDPVPHAPFQLGFDFVHYGTEFWSPQPKSLNILKCSPDPNSNAESEKCSNAIYMDLSTTTVSYHSLLPGIQF